VEVVIVAMKPLSHGTYIDQALDNGHGVTWLDDARIPSEPIGVPGYELRSRFPANLLCSDDCLNDGRVQVSGRAIRRRSGGKTFGGENSKPPMDDMGYADSGSFSRYFSLDAWAIANLPESVQRTFPFLIVPKAGKKEKEMGLDDMPKGPCSALGINDDPSFRNAQGRSGDNKTTNRHPTVKPLKLMSYLVTLGSRPGDLVLDPFAGTCKTGQAAEIGARDWLMIEMEEKWCQIGHLQIGAVGPWPDKAPVEIVVRDKTWLQPRLDPL